MYLGDAILEDWKEAIDLLKAAHKYQMESLVQKCAQYLQEHIDLSNVCYIYSKAVTYTLSPLGKDNFLLLLGVSDVLFIINLFILLFYIRNTVYQSFYDLKCF